jgi:uncharacterized protein (TIGR00369 family)
MNHYDTDSSESCGEPAVVDSQTRRLVAGLVAAGAVGKPIDCNPAFTSLGLRYLGGRQGMLVLGLTAGPQAIQGAGLVGGGTIANMLDCAIAVAVLSCLGPGQDCVTISLTVNMLAAGHAGDFTADTSLDRLGRRVAFAGARLHDASGRLIATASASLAIVTR